MQSTDLLEEAIPERGGHFPVNKRQESALGSSLKYFKKVDDGNPKNMRLVYKFHKMRDQNIAFLNRHTAAQCKTAMDRFTVSGFEKRILMKKSEGLQLSNRIICKLSEEKEAIESPGVGTSPQHLC